MYDWLSIVILGVVVDLHIGGTEAFYAMLVENQLARMSD